MTTIPLVSWLARSTGAAELLPQLHQHALDVTGGRCALLLEQNPRNGTLQATSAFGLDSLGSDLFAPSPAEARLIDDAFSRGAAALVGDTLRETPDLGGRLGSPVALLIPLVQDVTRIGLLAIGFATVDEAGAGSGTTEIADAFVTALELFKLQRADQLRRDVRALLDEFAGTLGVSLNLAAGLEIFCHGANQLFGADRTSVWLHDRRARHLALTASSDQEYVTRALRVAADDLDSTAAGAMRRSRAEIILPADEAVTVTVTIPLRGCRRALGTIVFEGVRVDPGGELALLDRADELGGPLSSAIENVQLIDEAMRSRRELEDTFDSLTDLVAVADRRGRIVHVNQAFAARSGMVRADLAERPLADFVGADLARWVGEHPNDGRADRERRATTREIVDPVLRGAFLVTLTDLVTSSHERAGTVLVARDLTPQTLLEAEREELRKRLTQSEKLAALGQFVAGIAHELNNPLQAVLGHLELLRVTGAFPRQLRKEVQTIYREADRAAKIVRNLLVFAGSRHLAKRRVSVNAIVQKVVALRAAACRAAEIEVVRHYDEKLPRVDSDPLLLHQAFLNIVMNAEQAIAATPGPGRIEISTAAPTRNRIVVAVRDSGGGIPADALSRIFEPFYTTKEVGKGTGLGLAIAYGIVQEHGGHISAENHPEGGAVFRIELPASAPAPGRHDDR